MTKAQLSTVVAYKIKKNRNRLCTCFNRYYAIKFTATPTVTSVDNVWPLYGPVAGGTRVTITGQYLSTVTDVYFGQHRGVIDRHRSAVLLHSFLLQYVT